MELIAGAILIGACLISWALYSVGHRRNEIEERRLQIEEEQQLELDRKDMEFENSIENILSRSGPSKHH